MVSPIQLRRGETGATIWNRGCPAGVMDRRGQKLPGVASIHTSAAAKSRRRRRGIELPRGLERPSDRLCDNVLRPFTPDSDEQPVEHLSCLASDRCSCRNSGRAWHPRVPFL
jgi:hypothetical protein